MKMEIFDAHQILRRCPSEWAEMGIRTGGDAHQNGKPPQWFAKSTAVVL